MPLPASRTTVERLDDRRVDELEDVLEIVLDHFAALVAAHRRLARRQLARHDHLPDLLQADVAAQRLGVPGDQLDAVVFLRVVRRRDLRAAVQPVAAHREIHHVGRQHAVVDDVASLLARALDERLGKPRRRRAHVARHGNPPGAEVGHEAAADVVRGRFVDLGRVEAPHVIGLEDVRVHDVHVCHASVPGAGPQARRAKCPRGRQSLL